MKRINFTSIICFFGGLMIFVLTLSFAVSFSLCLPLHAEEGMLPLSEIHKLDLKTKGLKIDPAQVYNPNGISLIDGIINLSGCTASFVSGEGLILTNYHCAFRAIQSLTTKDDDYMQAGFLAKERGGEMPAKSYRVRITESYRDVSTQVLSVVKKKMDYAERTKAIEKKIKEIELKAEKQNPGKRARVAEMFVGKSYVLFISTDIKDVRLVFAPPRSIGEYGGEIDNWMWPRHTGDFAFMRAYVAPDGAMAGYSPENVPYRPRKHLKIAPQGVKAEDFVFILGYPGRTRRHSTSHFVSFEEEVRLPYVVDLYGKLISVLEEMSEQDRAAAIKLAPRTGGFWNRKKRYSGQLQGLKKVKLVDKKRAEEKAMQDFIDRDKKNKKKYGNLLESFANFYAEKRATAEYELTLDYLFQSYPLRSAYTVYEASIERKKKDTDRLSAYMERNFSRTKERLEMRMSNYFEPYEKVALKEMLLRAARLKGDKKIAVVENIIKGKTGTGVEKAIDAFIEASYKKTKLKDPAFVMGLFGKNPAELKSLEDPFLEFAAALSPDIVAHDKNKKRRKGISAGLLSRLVDIKKQFLGKDFLPDANSTLRLTYGRVRGYSPKDAVYSLPFTTIKGIVEKHTGQEPFDAPLKLMDLHRAKDFGQFKHPELDDVPVAMLYNLDTVGGNSGSPVLNAFGELVGLNFDRVYEATINDYAWNESYSRSIGVDVRFILWFTQKFAGADHLLKEMNIF
ncbi:MAG: S46 family peptidase [Candidatus Aminicenantes bacterium]|nr:S46 family peptidase [Candidatus Aminicenantes bacterium]